MLDRSELTDTYRRFGPTALRRARRMLGNDADAREVVQDVFLSLFETPGQYAGTSSLTTFLYAATTNACLTRLRNQRARARLREEHELALLPTDDRLSQEQELLLRSTLQKMPGELASVAVYHFMDGLTHDEIAELVGCSRRHVGNQLLRAQRWLEEGSSS